MQLSTYSRVVRKLIWGGILSAAIGLSSDPLSAESLLVIEADTGKVLFAQNAGYPWYPASVTKLMTAYVTLRAVKEGRLTLDQPLTVSANAVAQSPVKMGFGVGTQVTVDNALKMLMVKSANDIAVVLAEGVGGSIESFADQTLPVPQQNDGCRARIDRRGRQPTAAHGGIAQASPRRRTR